MNFNVVQRELAHVDDTMHKLQMLGDMRWLYGLNDPDRLLSSLADVIWSEYYARRKCVKTAGEGNVETILMLVDYLNKKIPGEIESLKAEYWSRPDLRWMLTEASTLVGGLLGFMATLYGTKAGLGDEGWGESWRFFPSGLNDVYVSVTEALRVLWKRYPKWSGLEEFWPLKKAVAEAFRVFGMVFFDTPQGIDFTVET